MRFCLTIFLLAVSLAVCHAGERGTGGAARIKPYASQIAGSPTPATQYLGTPSFLIDSAGNWWASHNWFYDVLTGWNQTLIYRSTNKGGSWTLVRTITGLFWAKLFEYDGDLYAIGTNERNSTTGGGNLVIFKSTDLWATAPTSTTIFSDLEYLTAANSHVIQDGYFLYALSDRTSTSFADSLRTVLAFGNVTDLMTAGNWGKSNTLAYNQAWNDPSWDADNSGWVEPNIINDSGTLKILARHHNTVEHKACLIDVSWTPATPTATLSFNETTGFIDVPGGSVQFVLWWHAPSSKWITLSNHRTATRSADPNNQRDEMWLCSSPNLTTWTAVKQIHGQPEELDMAARVGEDVTKFGVAYAAGQLSENNNVLHFVTRTSWRGGNTAHNNNRCTYDFVSNLNALLQ